MSDTERRNFGQLLAYHTAPTLLGKKVRQPCSHNSVPLGGVFACLFFVLFATVCLD
ncbi:MAG: hypothetical protein J6A19_06220 [Oscillospiraceae bacterium]|nr:hypothetical protein [Oscillospiraceae bacterium]